MSRLEIREEFNFGPISAEILCFYDVTILSEKIVTSKVDWKNPFKLSNRSQTTQSHSLTDGRNLITNIE